MTQRSTAGGVFSAVDKLNGQLHCGCNDIRQCLVSYYFILRLIFLHDLPSCEFNILSLSRVVVVTVPVIEICGNVLVSQECKPVGPVAMGENPVSLHGYWHLGRHAPIS